MFYSFLLTVQLLLSPSSINTDISGKWNLTHFYSDEAEKNAPLMCKEVLELKKNGNYEIKSSCYLTESFESIESGKWSFANGVLKLESRKFADELNTTFYVPTNPLELQVKVEDKTMSFKAKNMTYEYIRE